jgi:hypothetical protein
LKIDREKKVVDRDGSVWFSDAMKSARALGFCVIVLCLLASNGFAETATLNSVDVLDLGDRLVATRDRTSPSQIHLEPKEKVQWIGAKGAVGVALTDRRFLAISETSSGWQQIRLRSEDGALSEVALGANIALLVTKKRILGFDGPSGLITEERFHIREAVVSSGVNELIGVVATSQRVIGFAAGRALPIERRFQLHEAFETLRVLDTTATVRTSRRILFFESSTGSWRDEDIRFK